MFLSKISFPLLIVTLSYLVLLTQTFQFSFFVLGHKNCLQLDVSDNDSLEDEKLPKQC